MDWLDEAVQLEATPKRLRTESVVAFCARCGIERGTYYYEVSKIENRKRVLEITLTHAKDEAPEVLDVLVQKAKSGDGRSIDTYIQFVLQLARSIDVKSDGKPLSIIVPEVLAAKHGIATSVAE